MGQSKPGSISSNRGWEERGTSAVGFALCASPSPAPALPQLSSCIWSRRSLSLFKTPQKWVQGDEPCILVQSSAAVTRSQLKPEHEEPMAPPALPNPESCPRNKAGPVLSWSSSAVSASRSPPRSGTKAAGAQSQGWFVPGKSAPCAAHKEPAVVLHLQGWRGRCQLHPVLGAWLPEHTLG